MAIVLLPTGILGAVGGARTPSIAPPGPGTLGDGARDSASAANVAPDSGWSFAASMAWVPQHPAAPNPVDDAGFAALSINGTGVLFGGTNATGAVSDQTWLYNDAQNMWTQPSLGMAPSARSDFGFATDPSAGDAVLFGGQLNNATGRVGNDTWLFTFGTNLWSNVSLPVAPAPRQDPALAVGDGVAVLYGGWNRNVSGTGELTYSDTWVLNLSTDVWAPVPPNGGPSPGALHGATLLWQPSLGEFLLFGGCYPCSSALWAFSPITDGWSAISPRGVPPSPRMDAVWVWDPSQAADILFGGTNGTAATASTYFLQPTTLTWTRAYTPVAPSARAGSAADFLNVPGNATLLLSGGSNGAGPLPDSWRFAAVSNLTVEVTNVSSDLAIGNASVTVASLAPLLTDASGLATAFSIPAAETTVNVSQAGYASTSQTLGILPGTNVRLSIALAPLAPATFYLTVTSPNGSAVPSVTVGLTYDTHLVPGSPHYTNATGFAAFYNVPSANYTVTLERPNFHYETAHVDLVPGRVTWQNLTLLPLFLLTVHTYGRLPNGNVSVLQGVTVSVGGTTVGITNATGGLATLLVVTGNLTVTASVAGYLNASAGVEVNETGAAEVNLTLNVRAYPTILIEVLGQRGNGPGFQVREAYVNVTNTTSLPAGPYSESFITDVEGTVTFSPPSGSYAIRVAAVGYLANNSLPTIVAPSGSLISRTVYLSLIGFSTVDVHVLSAANGNPPVGGAQLYFRFTATNLSTGLPFPPVSGLSLPTGWANVSGVPEGKADWIATAAGYLTENGTFNVVFNAASNSFTVYLIPVPPASYTGLKIFPGVPGDAWPLALVPVAGLLGALVYLTMLRNPAAREREIRETTRADRDRINSQRRP